MLIQTVNRDILKSLVVIDVAAVQAHDASISEYVEYVENPWSCCHVYVAAHYAGFIGRSLLKRTSFESQEAFEQDVMYEILVDAAVLDLCENIAKALVQLELVIGT